MPRVNLGVLRDTNITKMCTENFMDHEREKTCPQITRSSDKIEERQNGENSQDELSMKSLSLEI